MSTFSGGVHPLKSQHEGKSPTRDLPIREFVAKSVCIPMGMHLGAPSAPCVKKGDIVKLGQVIGEPVGGLGIPVHASVSGEVTDVSEKPYITDKPVMCVTIKNDLRDTWVDGIEGIGAAETVDTAKVLSAIKDAGICGMGGATFPTHVKLTMREGQTCDTVIINGAECETYLTADDRLMREGASRIIDGLRIVMRTLNAKKGVVAIEDNKPEAIKAMREAAEGRENVTVMPLETKYPQGGEKQLVYSVTGREIPTGEFPLSVNAIVLNVGTAYAIAEAIIDGKPLISRITTVTGDVKAPANLRLRVGTLIGDAINECDGFASTPGKIVLGGAMTGIAAPDDSIPMAKATNGIVVYNEKDASDIEEKACIRCARCVETCPMGLQPYQIKYACEDENMKAAKALNVMDCTVCGCCSYVCPANRWLTGTFKVMKDEITLAAKRG